MNWSSVKTFAVTALIGCACVAIVGLVCLLRWKEGTSDVFGIPPGLRDVTLAAYVPVLLLSTQRYRNVAYHFVTVGKGRPRILEIQNPGVLYSSTIAGVLIAIAALLYASIGSGQWASKIALGFGATVWGLTINDTYDRFFRSLGEAEFGTSDVTARAAEPED